MIASDLIGALEALVAQHGDLEVYAQDGLDPSDEMPVNSVDLARPSGHLHNDSPGFIIKT